MFEFKALRRLGWGNGRIQNYARCLPKSVLQEVDAEQDPIKAKQILIEALAESKATIEEEE